MKDLKISIKDLVGIIIMVVSITTTWAVMQGKITTLEGRVAKMETISTERLDERMKGMEKQVDEISKQTDEIYRVIMSGD